LGPIGIVCITGAVADIEELTGLSHGANQGIVASCALFSHAGGVMVPISRSFGMALGGSGGSVEVESQ
jgi:hypothetical protein